MHQAQGNEKSLKRGGGEEQALGEFNHLSSSTFYTLDDGISAPNSNEPV